MRRPVTLRSRLAFAFALVALVPLVAAAVVVAYALPHAARDRAMTRSAAAARTVATGLRQSCTVARLSAEQLAARAGDPAALAAATQQVISSGAVALVAIVAADGTPPTVTGALAELSDPVPALLALQPCDAVLDVRVLVARTPLADGRVVVAAARVDRRLLLMLRESTGERVGVTVAAAGVAPVTTLDDAGLARSLADAGLRSTTTGTRELHGQAATTVGLGGPGAGVLVVSSPVDGYGRPLLLLALVLLVALLVAVVIGVQLARVVTRPLARLSAAADSITAGDLDTRVNAEGNDEVASLGTALNEMTGSLRRHIAALEGSRDELRRNLTRLGDTLSSTHDLDKILGVILDTAQASVRAEAGVILLSSAGRGDLYAAVSRGLADRLPPGSGRTLLRVESGVGVLGRVHETQEGLAGTVGDGLGELHLAAVEPHARAVIAVPLRTSGSVSGVLGLYDREDGAAFDPADVDTIKTFAAQAGVAIDNVMLHQEAQRLSITDGLTGLWNYRYLTGALGREVERATRFGRPLAVLMMDLDRFKSVNDSYGHQRGDAVLVEVATRLTAQIREVDVLARYGGEEIVAVLPETDAEGAAVIAQRIVDEVRGEPFGGGEGELPLHITVSIGVAAFPDAATTASALLRRADQALYAAKDGGRNTVRVAPPTPAEDEPADHEGRRRAGR